jgi:ribulose-phosphate 3-epimerase
MQISVSYLSSYYSNEKTVMMLESTSADYIHVDLMDGGFVDSKNFTTDNVLKLLKNHEKPLDIHLMTFDPLIYINDLAVLKPEYITFHLEATKDIVKTIELIKRNNIKVGISIKPATNILELMPYLALVDLVLLMSVEPGAGGQNFIYHIADKLKDLKKARTENNLNFKIAMDGGLNEDTIKLVKDLDIAVVGSYICKSNNYEERIKLLKDIH